jgi:uncharacterized Tic20 family protein
LTEPFIVFLGKSESSDAVELEEKNSRVRATLNYRVVYMLIVILLYLIIMMTYGFTTVRCSSSTMAALNAFVKLALLFCCNMKYGHWPNLISWTKWDDNSCALSQQRETIDVPETLRFA